MEPHLGSMQSVVHIQAGILPAHHCRATISLSTAAFYVKSLLLNVIRYQFVQCDSRLLRAIECRFYLNIDFLLKSRRFRVSLEYLVLTAT